MGPFDDVTGQIAGGLRRAGGAIDLPRVQGVLGGGLRDLGGIFGDALNRAGAAFARPLPTVQPTFRPLGTRAPFGGLAGGGIADVFNTRFGGASVGYQPTFRPIAPPAPASDTRASATPGGGGATSGNGLGSAQWADMINQEAARYGDAPELAEVAQAVAELESNGRADAQGVVVTGGPYAGQRAQGLMQIMPGNYPGVNLMDPRTNVQKGLAMLYERYKRYGNWDKAVAAYFGAIDANGNITGARDDNGTSGYAYTKTVNDFRATIRAARTQGAGQAGGVNPSGYSFPVVGFSGKVGLHQGSSNGAADLFAPLGTAIGAMRGGVVESAGWSSIGGWNATIRGDDGLTYYYAHMREQPTVAAGQRVAAGGRVGSVGETGNAAGTGPHLHLGVGYGIQSGVGPQGGAGIDFDVTTLLNRILGGG